MSKQYYQIKFSGVVTIEAEDDFEAGMKFKDMEFELPLDMELSDVEMLDV